MRRSEGRKKQEWGFGMGMQRFGYKSPYTGAITYVAFDPYDMVWTGDYYRENGGHYPYVPISKGSVENMRADLVELGYREIDYTDSGGE